MYLNPVQNGCLSKFVNLLARYVVEIFSKRHCDYGKYTFPMMCLKIGVVPLKNESCPLKKFSETLSQKKDFIIGLVEEV